MVRNLGRAGAGSSSAACLVGWAAHSLWLGWAGRSCHLSAHVSGTSVHCTWSLFLHVASVRPHSTVVSGWSGISHKSWFSRGHVTGGIEGINILKARVRSFTASLLPHSSGQRQAQGKTRFKKTLPVDKRSSKEFEDMLIHHGSLPFIVHTAARVILSKLNQIPSPCLKPAKGFPLLLKWKSQS